MDKARCAASTGYYAGWMRYAYPPYTADPEQAPLLTANQPADLWLIRWVHATKHQMFKDPQYFPRRFEAMAKRFNAQKVWTSSDGKYELYYARIEPEG